MSASDQQEFKDITDEEYDQLLKEIINSSGPNGELDEKWSDMLNTLPVSRLQRLIRDSEIAAHGGSGEQEGSATQSTNGYAVLSYINVAEKRMEQMKQASLSGFLYHILSREYEDMQWEYTPKPPTDSAEYAELIKIINAKKLVVKEFLDRVFKFNPELHVRSAAWPWSDDVTRSVLPNRSKAARMTKTVAVSEITKGSDDPSLTLPSYVSLLDADKPEVTRLDPKSIKVGDVYVPVPSYDLFIGWKAYENANQDDFKQMLDDVYETKDNIRNVVRIYETFPATEQGLQAATEYRDKISLNTGLSLYVVDKGKWVVMEEDKESMRRTRYNNESVLKGILDNQAEQGRIANKLRQNIIRRRKKVTAKAIAAKMASSNKSKGVLPEDMRTREAIVARRKELAEEREKIRYETSGMSFEDYKRYAGGQGAMRGEDIEEPDELDRMVEQGLLDPRDVYENVDEEGIPLNAVALDVLVNKGDKFEKRRIFIEEDKDISMDIRAT